MIKTNKRGITPLVATIILTVVILIALISVFIWFRTLTLEELEKFGNPIENACQDISFSVSISRNKFIINNTGTVPIYGINLEIVKDGADVAKFLRPEDKIIEPAESETLTASATDVSGKIERIVLVPVILGKVKGTESEKLYTCLDQGQIVL